MEELIREFNYYVSRLGVKAVLNTSAQHDGSSHVEIVNGKFHWIVTERGEEFEHRVTDDKDEVLYWLLSDIAFRLASDYEVSHRILRQDPRRQLFDKEIELMTKLKKEWAERKRIELESILQDHPFDDKNPLFQSKGID